MKGSLAFSPEESAEVYTEPKAFFADGSPRKVVVLNKVIEKREGAKGPYVNVIWTFADAETLEPYETKGINFDLTNAFHAYKETMRLETSVYSVTATLIGKNPAGFDKFKYDVQYVKELDGTSPNAKAKEVAY